MLSVVVYGRNDSHGYNLHKRAALSLNAIAEQLTDQNDEIIFVDYNTPDEIPTFPEAIADTLTPKTKQVLRVIRVRPKFHQGLGIKTRLVALEPHARNIAIRRVNPNNRWVLSSNTDMIFAPKHGGSLSELVGALDDGFYHLPRFELPEGFWERLDRLKPRDAIETVVKWGQRFHLNEVVYGDHSNLYDAPGDFQLFLRDDMLSIDGLDESMIHGWHVDSNIARRMDLLRGRVDTVEDRLLGYHCGHTRQATIYHAHDSLQNSWEKYGRDVAQADLPEQRDHWGAPHQSFEELRLDEQHTSGYFSALEHGIPTAAERTYEGRHPVGPGVYRDQYESNHVLPYLCDLLSSVAKPQKVLFLGSDDRLLDGLSTFLSQMDLGSVVVPDDGPQAQLTSALSMPFEAALIEADCFVVQYPESQLRPEGRQKDERWRAALALDRIAEVERGRSVTDRRRVIVVNCNDNPLQRVVERLMSFTVMPYGCRIRHGYIFDAPITPGVRAEADPARADLLRRFNREIELQPTEVELLRSAVEALARPDADISDLGRLALEIEALDQQRDAAAGLALDPALLAQAAGLAQTTIAQASAFSPHARPVGPRIAVANRLCSGMDWEDPKWRDILARTFFGPPYGLQYRDPWVWARISLEVELELRVDRRDRPWVLVIALGPDVQAAIAAMRGFRVAYATPGQLLGLQPEADWSEAFIHIQSLMHKDVLPFSKAIAAMAPGETFAATILMEQVLETSLNGQLQQLYQATAERRGDRHFLLASPLVRLDPGPGEGALPYSEWRELFASDGPLTALGFQPSGTLDHSIPLDTLIKYKSGDHVGGSVPGLSYGSGGSVKSVALVSGVLDATPAQSPRRPSEHQAPAQTPLGKRAKVVFMDPASVSSPAPPLPVFNLGSNQGQGHVANGQNTAIANPSVEAPPASPPLSNNCQEGEPLPSAADSAPLLAPWLRSRSRPPL